MLGIEQILNWKNFRLSFNLISGKIPLRLLNISIIFHPDIWLNAALCLAIYTPDNGYLAKSPTRHWISGQISDRISSLNLYMISRTNFSFLLLIFFLKKDFRNMY